MILLNLSYVQHSDSGMRNEIIFRTILKQSSFFEKGIFVNPPKVLPPSASLKTRYRHFFKLEIKKSSHGYLIITPIYYLPFTYLYRTLAYLQARTIIKKIYRAYLRKEKYCLWINSPNYTSFNLAMCLRKRADFVVFDIADDFTSFDSGNKKQIESHMKQLLEMSDAVLAVNRHVLDKFTHPQKEIFRNCTDYTNFQRQDANFKYKPFLPKPIGNQYIGFIGGINKGRIDLNLLDLLFEAFPTITFLFVGYSNDKNIINYINSQTNACFIPFVPYSELPFLIKSFDVAIIPHLINEHTDGNDLLKILDYMACGVPIVSTNCSGVHEYEDCVCIANSNKEFVDFVNKILKKEIVQDQILCKKFAQQRSWDQTVPELEKSILKQIRGRYEQTCTSSR